jgi:hypothetical protein
VGVITFAIAIEKTKNNKKLLPEVGALRCAFKLN